MLPDPASAIVSYTVVQVCLYTKLMPAQAFPSCSTIMSTSGVVHIYKRFIAVVRQSALVIKVGVAHTGYQVHEACIEVATVYKVGVA